MGRRNTSWTKRRRRDGANVNPDRARLEPSIPDRSPGHAFVPMTKWYSELARRILPRPTPTPAGDKPPRYIFSFRHRPSVYNSARFAGGEPASRLIEGHIFVRMTNSVAGTYVHSDDRCGNRRGVSSGGQIST